MKRRPKPRWVKNLALKRIITLFKLAEENKYSHPERARRYIELARKISKKYTVKIPSKLKKKFCKNCNTFFTAENVKIRKIRRKNALLIVCLTCNKKTLRRAN